MDEIGQYFNSDPEYEQLEEKLLIKKLEDRSFLDEVTKSESWRIFREAWRRMAADADKILTTCNPSDVATIAFAQATKRFYSEVLRTTISQIKQDGDVAIKELRRLNKLGSIQAKKKHK